MKIWMFVLLLLAAPAWGAPLRVTIDPGHGGEEKGAVHGGVVEAEVALQIAKKLHQRLQKDPLFQVQLLRHQDQTLELEDRVKRSKKFSTDLFLSIHANANPNSKISGIEFYIQNQLPVDEESLFLAHMEHGEAEAEESKPQGDVESILYDLEKSHKILRSYQVGSYLRSHWNQRKAYPVRQGPFYVLSHNEIPSVLIEVGYLTHPRERRRLSQRDYQLQIAHKIHNGLKDYLNNRNQLPRAQIK